jgi:hypothetical protein
MEPRGALARSTGDSLKRESGGEQVKRPTEARELARSSRVPVLLPFDYSSGRRWPRVRRRTRPRCHSRRRRDRWRCGRCNTWRYTWCHSWRYAWRHSWRYAWRHSWSYAWRHRRSSRRSSRWCHRRGHARSNGRSWARSRRSAAGAPELQIVERWVAIVAARDDHVRRTRQVRV